MKITINTKKAPVVIDLPASSTIEEVKKEFSKNFKKISIHRVSLKQTLAEGKEVRLDNPKKTLQDYGITSDATLVFKDLGPQIGYRTVFLLEYFGPMLFVGLWALRPSFLYSNTDKPYDPVAILAIACWMLHFLKREFETIFVHKFSRPTMPLNNLFKNCTYYWTFGAAIGYPLCNPSYVPPSPLLIKIGLAIFILSELGNLKCHLMLSNMRPKEGSQQRDIPRGFLFNLVACPNYTFEIMSWVGFSIMTMIPMSFLFTIVGFLQMTEWAIKKHKGYKKDFPEEYPKLKRKAIIPFIL